MKVLLWCLGVLQGCRQLLWFCPLCFDLGMLLIDMYYLLYLSNEKKSLYRPGVAKNEFFGIFLLYSG